MFHCAKYWAMMTSYKCFVWLKKCSGWSIAVSGSRDRTAIIWDLSRYVYIKHMPGHVGPVAAVAINEMTGDIMTCAGAWLYLWDVNGRPVAKVNTVPHVSRPLRSGTLITAWQSTTSDNSLIFKGCQASVSHFMYRLCTKGDLLIIYKVLTVYYQIEVLNWLV